MTADDVVEAMARAAHEASAPSYPWAMLNEKRREHWRDIIRAAIRAVHDAGGLVVGKMPGDRPPNKSSAYAKGHVDGHNAALAKVRAAAVEPPHDQ